MFCEWLQICNLSIEVSLTLKVIVQVALALIYILQFSNTNICDFTVHTCSKYINHYLLTKEAKKITLVANSIPSKCLKFGSRCLESNLSHLFKCTYAQLRSVLGLLQNISVCPMKQVKQVQSCSHAYSIMNDKMYLKVLWQSFQKENTNN